MKKIKLILAALVLSASIQSVNAQELPAPSPAATISQTVGLTNVDISYSRPNVKGRDIFGSLVPFGKVWRTGANKATNITLSNDVKINGIDVKAGSYALFTIPNATSWDIIINTQTESWGSYDYNDTTNVAKFSVKPEKVAFTETFTIEFVTANEKGGKIALRWAETKVSFDVTVDDSAIAQKNIEAKLKELEDYYPFYKSAQYYNDNNLDKAKAAEFAQKAVDKKPRYWTYKVLAVAQANLGKFKEALATIKLSNADAIKSDEEGFVNGNKKLIEEWSKK